MTELAWRTGDQIRVRRSTTAYLVGFWLAIAGVVLGIVMTAFGLAAGAGPGPGLATLGFLGGIGAVGFWIARPAVFDLQQRTLRLPGGAVFDLGACAALISLGTVAELRQRSGGHVRYLNFHLLVVTADPSPDRREAAMETVDRVLASGSEALDRPALRAALESLLEEWRGSVRELCSTTFEHRAVQATRELVRTLGLPVLRVDGDERMLDTPASVALPLGERLRLFDPAPDGPAESEEDADGFGTVALELSWETSRRGWLAAAMGLAGVAGACWAAFPWAVALAVTVAVLPFVFLIPFVCRDHGTNRLFLDSDRLVYRTSFLSPRERRVPVEDLFHIVYVREPVGMLRIVHRRGLLGIRVPPDLGADLESALKRKLSSAAP